MKKFSSYIGTYFPGINLENHRDSLTFLKFAAGRQEEVKPYASKGGTRATGLTALKSQDHSIGM